MIFENTDVFGFDPAIRGMRNPLASWDRGDSYTDSVNGEFCMGENDMTLAKKLINAGTEHRKFLRQIQVWVDISAPLYWWKEFDTYKVGTVANSTSTMHKLVSKEITTDMFETEGMWERATPLFEQTVSTCELLRKAYHLHSDKEEKEMIWRSLVQVLPESWIQTRTVTMNYENLLTMYRQRKTHKLSEWSEHFVNWMLELPYMKEFLGLDEVVE